MLKCDVCGTRKKLGSLMFSVTTYHIGESLSPEDTEEICYDCYNEMLNISAKVRLQLRNKAKEQKGWGGE